MSTETRPRVPDTSSRTAARPRVAIVCPGVGVEQRGFERYFDNLFHVVQDELDIVLFKGGGPRSDREIVLRFARRNGRLLKYFPVHRLFRRSAIHAEDLTFAVALLPHLRGGRFDVVHTIDPPLQRALFRARKVFKMPFRLLYTEGTAMPPEHYPPADHIHQVAAVTFDEAKRHGIPEEKMTLVPVGFHARRFEVSASRAELRRKHGVPENRFVILCVAALNRNHKRVDHLIDEAAKLDGDFLLWLDGSMDQGDPTLIPYAREKLGDRVRITCVPSAQVGELFALADIKVLASVHESFGLVIVEALSAGLPVVTHDNAHFRWVNPCPHSHVDMRAPGALATLLRDARGNPGRLRAMRHPVEARQRFDWEYLRQPYVDLYAKVARLPTPAR